MKMNKEKFLQMLVERVEYSEKHTCGFDSEHEAGMYSGQESILHDLIYEIQRGVFDEEE